MRLRTVVIIGQVLAGVAYVAVFRRAAVAKTAKGYKPADTPQVAAAMLKKAVQEREYEIAADYCTAGFAEQLRRGATAAHELAVALDDLTYQLNERGLMRDEVRLAFQALDPFPKDVTIVVSEGAAESARGRSSSGSRCCAAITRRPGRGSSTQKCSRRTPGRCRSRGRTRSSCRCGRRRTGGSSTSPRTARCSCGSAG